MKIDNILVRPSPVHGKGIQVLHMEVGGDKFSGYFAEDMGSFLTCVKEAAEYFAVRQKKLGVTKQTTTKPVLTS